MPLNITDFFGKVQSQRVHNMVSTIVDTEKQQLIEKAKDLSQLTQITITDKNSHQRKVWVKLNDLSAEQVAQQITQVASNESGRNSDKVRSLVSLGLTDKKEIASITGAHYSQVHQIVKKHQSTNKPSLTKEQEAVVLETIPNEIQQGPKISVQQRWDSYGVFVDMVAEGMAKSCIAYGTGGVGKTYTMSQVLKKYGMTEYRPDAGHVVGDDNYDYVKITGKATPTAMYKALYEHNDKLIVFDDCDSVLKDQTSVNIFKGALDTSGDGTVVYDSGRKIKTNKPGVEDHKGNPIVPPRFDFTGRVIFISNLSPNEMPQPLVDSRALAVDLTMNISDTVQRLRDISNVIPIEDIEGNPLPNVTEQDRNEVVDLIEKHSTKIRPGKLNARTFINLTKIKVKLKDNPSINWKDAAVAMLT